MNRRPKNPKPSREHDTRPKPARSLSRRREWLFRLSALLLPLLALGVLEVGLLVAGYGYPTDFFKKVRIGDEAFLVQNDKVGLRFFPPELLRMPPAIRMQAKKPDGSYRIFILGESAAMGDPEAGFGAGRYLEVLLGERFPQGNFEVVNVAMTAINSHAILPIARESARHDGDLWIIYMGNNEMVGPFGAATVFGARSAPLGFVRLNLALQKTRVGQLIVALGRKLKSKSSDASSWGGMQMFLQNRIPPTDRNKEAVYQNFRRNLEDILRAGFDSGAKVILNTVAVNLKDSPPFASISNSNLFAAGRAQFDNLYAEGRQAERQGDSAQAVQLYELAARGDPHFAELQFRWGDCLLRLTNAAAARQHFQLACDFDALPFRTDSRINGLIRQIGEKSVSGGLVLFDAAAVLETNNPAGICGQESFYEHVHFNFDGNYRLGRAWAGQVERFLPKAITNQPASAWASQEICERRLGLTDWNRTSVLDEVIRRLQRPPLSGQFNNAARLEALQKQVDAMRDRMTAATAAKAREIYLEAVKRAPHDFYLHQNFADFLVALHDWKAATVEWQRVRELIPHDYLAYLRVGWLFIQQGQWAEAKSYSLKAAALHPGFSDVWLQLGDIHATEEKLELALQNYQRARQVSPHDARIYHQTGKLLWRMERHAEALHNLREAVQLRPDNWEMHFTLGGALGLGEHIAEAKKEFQEVIRLKPDYAMAHLNLGVALMKQGQLDDAQKKFDETIRLDPGNKLALDYLGQARAAKKLSP